MWFLDKKVTPTLDCIENYTTQKELYQELLVIIDKLDPISFQLDLESFIENKEFVKSLSQSIKGILIRQLKDNIGEK
jgi:hypothetical protein